MPFQERLNKIKDLLSQKGLDAVIIENPTDIYYLTGLKVSLGILFVSKSGEDALFVDGRYEEAARQVKAVETYRFQNDASTEAWFMEKPEWKKLGFDSDYTSYQAFLNWQKRLKNASSKAHLEPLNSPVQNIRSIKNAEEIKSLQSAANLGSEGYDFVRSILREGITEKEVALELDIFWKRKGGEGVSFDPIIAFGQNSSKPHYRPQDDRLKNGSIVLIDIGVTLNHYHSDMTRCVFFGTPDPFLKEVYLSVLKAQEAALMLCRPGVLIKEIDSAARDLLSPEHFVHGLGHGVGLEIHERPVLNNKHLDKELPLQEGMVITIEPGAYYPGIGGVRIEDTIVITNNGYEDLTKRPKDWKSILQTPA